MAINVLENYEQRTKKHFTAYMILGNISFVMVVLKMALSSVKNNNLLYIWTAFIVCYAAYDNYKLNKIKTIDEDIEKLKEVWLQGHLIVDGVNHLVKYRTEKDEYVLHKKDVQIFMQKDVENTQVFMQMGKNSFNDIVINQMTVIMPYDENLIK